ncbi:heart- and neural crest derivatives-expressed protein 1-like [Lolium rigidum]|uniref:heart- and neural crest derivatives-expressed protein 1-like n=1 Tax=Lolium rigidum TaxID=89674 RepID=UPI001F5D09B4|nr:heart- and neural crest derivatives-expressed protein 1-like [Lolium rigidum]
MDPPPQPSHHQHHHHRLHLRLDPGHHHHIHIQLCHHTAHLLPAAASCAHFQQQYPQSLFPYPPSAAPWHPEGGPMAGPQVEAARESEEPALQVGQEDVYLEGEEEEDEEPVFVLTDEWAEFFAKADAKRKLAKQQKKKDRKK